MRKLLHHLRLLAARWAERLAPPPPLPPEPPAPPGRYEPLTRLLLTDSVGRTLFTQYAEHRLTERGAEETGWVLLGLRQAEEAVALAALPAGAGREAGVAHVRFNAEAQAVASRILRQADRRLTMLGIVHTHPGSLRHPSQGDYEGDRQWVRLLRGGEGVFAIGTADAPESEQDDLIAEQPKPHAQTWLGLRFSWYALGKEDSQYRPLPVQLSLGPDLAAPLLPLWPILEKHAERLEAICRRLTQVRFGLLQEPEPMLEASVPLEGQRRLAVRLSAGGAVTYGERDGDSWRPLPLADPHPDHGLFALLVERSMG